MTTMFGLPAGASAAIVRQCVARPPARHMMTTKPGLIVRKVIFMAVPRLKKDLGRCRSIYNRLLNPRQDPGFRAAGT